MRMLKALDSRRTGGKRGFTLIELLIVMVILAILAGIVIISIGGVIGRGQETAYNAERESLQTAVLSYYASNNSTWPTSGETDPPSTVGNAGVIDMTLLTNVTAPELPYLDETPASANVDNNRDDAVTNGHYLWTVDASGHVFSECEDIAADDCTVAGDMDAIEDAGEDGWQDVYP